MSEAFSFNREFDFVRLDGLRRVTGRPPHEWDLYIVKELLDNALDADETLWREDRKKYPRLNIRMEYINVPQQQCHQLFVQVSNRARFPVDQIEDIFATQWYTSRKAFIKGLTRGALGNALKTLLGIPYALRNRAAGDWNPELKPLSILCSGMEYLPRFEVDSTAQTIRFEYTKKKGKSVDGTLISVGLDHFEQEMPRTLSQIKLLAEQYHLCNPHARFHWTVEIRDKEWTEEYVANPNWSKKFLGIAPIHWYTQSAFQDLLGALYRKQCDGDKANTLPIEAVCRCFAQFDNQAVTARQRNTISQVIKQKSLTAIEIQGDVSMQLYRALSQNSARFESTLLGGIGLEHMRTIINRVFPVDGDVLYKTFTDAGDEPGIPFVIEAAVAHLKEGKRQIWTAINFTPTYDDPFLRRWLRAPIKPDDPVLGLRGLMDAYDLTEDTPLALFLHLICPNIESNEFSKTEINHLPFKQVLGELMGQLLVALKQTREEAELRLEQTVFKMLDTILSELDENERFVFDQLLEKLCAKLSQDLALSKWLETPDAQSRLRTYITNYQSRNTTLTHHVARPAAGTLSIPLHSDRHFTVLTEHLSQDLLTKHHVNKILYLQVRELEPVVIENGWLCQMDMALLRNLTDIDKLQDGLMQCLVRSELPLMVLHNADDAGRDLVKQMRTWLNEKQLDTNRIIDLGLGVADGTYDSNQLTKLVEMMPSELAAWLIRRFKNLAIPLKSLPTDADIRRDIQKRFEEFILAHLWEGLSLKFEVTRLLADLDRQLHFTEAMIKQTLDRQLRNRLEKESCSESYAIGLEDVVGEFFESFMYENGPHFQELVQAHMTRIQKQA
ncbi:ATP-binding protein [candidate division KSB1 bacterium]|nr:MAG: ATP-binding protein [candidate division KSB1 bacterium]